LAHIGGHRQQDRVAVGKCSVASVGLGAEAPEKQRNNEGFWRQSSGAASCMFKAPGPSARHLRLESHISITMSAKGSLLLIGDLHFVRQQWEELGQLEGVTGLKVCTVRSVTGHL
jgi:hypothetical protein